MLKEQHENCTILSYCAAYSGNSLPCFRTTYWSYLEGSRILDCWRWDW